MAIGRVSYESAFHRASKFEHLFEFVFSQVPDAKSVKFIVSDMLKKGCRTGGITYGQGLVTIVFLGVSRGDGVYHHVNRHSVPQVDAAVGGTIIESWEEEVLLTLLHEARHVHQFEYGMFTAGDESDAAEIDAERFAKRGIAKWRRAQRIAAHVTAKMAA
jgi:hypothetical protein